MLSRKEISPVMKSRLQFPLFILIGLLISGCATESELQKRPVNRYLNDGAYTNPIKQFALPWPSNQIWKFENYPEVDLCFNHLDGHAQLFIISARGLLRREFPGGFADWILDRLQAQEIKKISQQELTKEPVEKFQILLDCSFKVYPGESFGISRRVSITAMRQQSKWLACVYLAPEKYFKKYLDEVQTIIDSVRILQD
jgi:hypothetical protein